MNASKTTIEAKAAMRAAKMCHTLALQAKNDSDRRTAYGKAAELYQMAGSWAMAQWCRESV